MEFDIYSLVVGIQDPKDLNRAEAQKQAYKEICVRVAQVTETDGWKELLKEMEQFEKAHSLSPEFYSQDPNLAHIHTGVLYTLKHIRTWADKANSFIKQKEYAQSQAQEK